MSESKNITFKYTCFACGLQLKNTVESPCHTLFCWDCAITSYSKCPKCQNFHSIEYYKERPDIDQILSPPQNVMCRYCSQQMLNTQIDRHLLECGEVTVSCSNNCGAIFPRKFQGEHSTSCPLQLKTCEMCKAKVFAYKYEEHMTQHSKTTPIFLLPPSLPNNNKNKNDSHTPTQLSPHHSPAQSHRSKQISNSSSSSSTPSLPTNTTPTTRHRTSSQLQSSPPLQQTSNVGQERIISPPSTNTLTRYLDYISPDRINHYIGYLLSLFRGVSQSSELFHKVTESLRSSQEKLSQNTNARNSLFLIGFLVVCVLVYIFSGPLLFLTKVAIFCFVIYSTWTVFNTIEFTRNENTRNFAFIGYIILCIYFIKMLL